MVCAPESLSGLRVITAAIYPHPHGHELRAFFGDESDGDLLHSELTRVA